MGVGGRKRDAKRGGLVLDKGGGAVRSQLLKSLTAECRAITRLSNDEGR